jgi:hypothetical protein
MVFSDPSSSSSSAGFNSLTSQKRVSFSDSPSFSDAPKPNGVRRESSSSPDLKSGSHTHNSNNKSSSSSPPRYVPSVAEGRASSASRPPSGRLSTTTVLSRTVNDTSLRSSYSQSTSSTSASPVPAYAPQPYGQASTRPNSSSFKAGVQSSGYGAGQHSPYGSYLPQSTRPISAVSSQVTSPVLAYSRHAQPYEQK